MPNSFYLRGRRAEYEAKEMLEKEGYEVYRTAGSHGRADLISIKDKLELIAELEAKSAVIGLAESGFRLCRLIQIKTCHEKDLEKYKKEKVPGVELWIKVLGHGWQTF